MFIKNDPIASGEDGKANVSTIIAINEIGQLKLINGKNL